MKQHQLLQLYVEVIAKGLTNSLIVQSPAGYGKSETTFKALKMLGLQKGVNYVWESGYLTPKGLLNALRRVNLISSPRILVLDDIEDTLKNLQTIGLLKSALWEIDGTRKVFWQTNREHIEFEFKGRIIFLLNKINENNPIVKALIDRSLYYQMDLTKDEMINLMREKIREFNELTYQQQQKIMKFIVKVGGENISLRKLPLAISLFKFSPNHYQELLNKLKI